MRALAVFAALCLLIAGSADAKPARSTNRPAKQAHPTGKRVATEREPRPVDPYAEPAPRRGRAKPPTGQSIGVPWSGRLVNATRLRVADGAFIRRPYRAYGTRTTVDHVRRAIHATLDTHPRAHVLAVGDISAQGGGQISDHNSHRTGRDIDLGLFYKKKPREYPVAFVHATEENLDRATTWALLANLLKTEGKDGGVQMIFLDFEVQGLLYEWARDRGISEARLERIFQYPHGEGALAGIIRHAPGHSDHIHVRFHCAAADTQCR